MQEVSVIYNGCVHKDFGVMSVCQARRLVHAVETDWELSMIQRRRNMSPWQRCRALFTSHRRQPQPPMVIVSDHRPERQEY